MLIAFKLKLALACAAGLAGPIAMAPLVSDMTVHGTASEPAIVRVAAGSLSYREAGDFTRGGQQAEAPLRAMRVDRPLHIMRNQVSSSDYQLCVQDGACRALDRDVAVAADRPAVQVSWHDAEAYAGWLSRKTGHHYRLPSDAEWAFAAGSRFKDDGVAVDADDPSKRWISRYERESERDLSDTTAYPFGKFGPNEHGVEDLAGNVWEWTSTCFVRSRVDAAGNAGRPTVNCGVRVAEGAHRAYVTDFIRDARAGGCAQGVPPANLGFRLVREETSWVASVSARWSKVWAVRS
ncbi:MULTISPECIES: SUMF1/EgtB/PvdO family nonheme iron enzyme [Bradyrhizobium]|uniref:Formylglycine-generating enzyme required for sulfatase activity n=1 Tax=Bradyrhizobium ottawaense TaxID=931866 RepID=A0ABV4FKI7_9BRAD|nr:MULTISPECIES: SUMF1/EgtB/PvdO family nonheme iron enzyme [Bradyrhizobium]MBR1290438.1 SUMF1/EgtB/PvdO family nonheme iron enzyme [Bradyrhizobium ottawaense]MBR1360491.1 SUMF1/EgtB/PvdO family nonheme iron enzyme [Bradyrhizobium ottawaense]MDA9416919.1 nitrate reductase [Bradyrhizobium sp. CCBAU 25360]MDA9446587.1 nitrate reductase [Bradyrhizobium sp. CCBAU 21360]MDA9458905.1 nitrate reductase [Bradyrhizobium sp. CCBAU 21359]